MSEKIREKQLVDELRAFFQGARCFVPDRPPTDISNSALTVLRALYALESAHRAAAVYYTARDAASPDARFDIEANNAGVHALGSLIEALKTGGTHPLLQYWQGKRAYAGGRVSGGSQNNLVKQHEVGAVCCMVQQGCPKNRAYKLVAAAVAKSRFRGDCQWSTVKNWVDHTPPDERKVLAESIVEVMHEAGEAQERWLEKIPGYLTLAIASSLATDCSDDDN
jgi:hypothetical protein